MPLYDLFFGIARNMSFIMISCAGCRLSSDQILPDLLPPKSQHDFLCVLMTLFSQQRETLYKEEVDYRIANCHIRQYYIVPRQYILYRHRGINLESNPSEAIFSRYFNSFSCRESFGEINGNGYLSSNFPNS